MGRTREWMKFGGLVVVTFVLAAAFAGAVDRPAAIAAEQQAAVLEVLSVDRPPPIAAAAQPVADLGEAFVSVAELIQPTVVFIRAETVEQGRQTQVPRGFEEFFPDRGQQAPRLRRGQGSGFIISSDGYILTNNHVVEGASKLLVSLLDHRVYEAEVVGRDPATDVAVIKIDARNLAAVSFGNSDSLRIGEWVLAVGNPLGEDFSFTVTAGIVSGKGRLLRGLPIESQYRIMDFIQTDAAINPGNSGGPLVNIRGQVVGINAAIASNTGYYNGYGFAIPVNLARVVANQLIADGRVTRAILGVAIVDVRQEDAEYVGLDEIRGVVVNDYSTDDSPARAAGIELGDVIVELDGVEVEYVGQLQQVVGFRRPGDVVEVTVLRRGGERHVIPVRLAQAPLDDAPQVAAQPEEPADEPSHETKLGIAVRPLSEEFVRTEERIGPEHLGLRVMEVDIESPAQQRLCPANNPRGCGFGDIITHIDGARVHTIEEFDSAVTNAGVGTIVSIRVFNPSIGQTGQMRTVRVRISR